MVGLRELFARADLAGLDATPIPEVQVHGMADDSRHVQAGTCFVAVRGTGVDGHRFVHEAVQRGAAAVVVEDSIRTAEGFPVVRVRDSRLAVARLAAAFHGLRGSRRQPIRLIGVTGTNGKTTVGWLVRAILDAAGHRTALLGTVENDIVGERETASLTTPGPVELCRLLGRAVERGAEFGVMEVSSHALAQRRCDGLTFSAGIFTNLTGDHLDYHGTMKEYAAAKRRLFQLLDGNGPAVINVDDEWCDAMVAGLSGRVIGYGLDGDRADYSARIESLTATGTRFVITAGTQELPIRSPLVGRHNVLNVLAAAATAHGLGVSEEAIRRGVESVRGVPGRLQRAEPDGHPFSVLVDYAHSDDALRNVLTAARGVTVGRVICVFGCGGDRDRSKRPRMGRVASELADVAFVTSDNPRSETPEAIIDDIVAGFDVQGECQLEVDPDRRRAIGAAIAEAKAGDTVLIAGKGHETYQLIGGRVHPFDDVAVAREFLMVDAAVEAA